MDNMDYQYYDDEPDYSDEDAAISLGDDVYADQEAQVSEKLEDEQTSAEDYTKDPNVTERLWDSYEHCIVPSLSQVTGYIMPLLLGCLLCRLLSAIYARRRRLVASSGNSWLESNSLRLAPLHLINALCGLGVLYATLGSRMLILLLLNGISYMLLQLVRLGRGERGAQTIAVLSIGSQFLYELAIWQKRDDWPQLRGLQMVSNMKIISLGYDLTATGAPGLHMPNILAYLGYVLNPASCALGPWISYARYLDSLHRKPHWRRSLCQMLLNVLLSLVALTFSNCIAPTLGELHLPPDEHATEYGSNTHWLLMYTGALSVRTSHYFVSLLSQAQLAAAGQQLDMGDRVVRPLRIEWPRSLSALVRCWNIPMHEWLKRYVYTSTSTSKQQPRSRQSTVVAVFCTYFVSSLLHGMDFRIYLVLLSLATFAEGESTLRRHLATLFNACIAANPCPGAERCRYTNCPQRRGQFYASSILVNFINLAFTLLAICHLAYLGVVLLNETLVMESSNELPFMYHWAAAGYLSHYVGIGMFILYLIIS